MKKLSLIHPTRGRPAMSTVCMQNWILSASGKNPIEYILSLDESDAFNYEEAIKTWRKFFEKYPFVTFIVNIDRTYSVTSSLNSGAKCATGDILISVFDDMVPPKDWDETIIKLTEGREDWVLFPFDGNRKDDLITICILDRKYYERFGYIYYPGYFSMWNDNDYSQTAFLLNKVIDVRKVFTIEHRHWAINKREKDNTDMRHDNAKTFSEGKRLYDRRKKDLFGVDAFLDPIKHPFVPINKDIYLTIMIPTLEERKILFESLVESLKRQIVTNNLEKKVEIIYLRDKGEEKIGRKRNRLLRMASGLFSVFIDDDDLVPDDYVKTFVEVIEKYGDSIDCIGFEGLTLRPNGKKERFVHSLAFGPAWYTNNLGTACRPPNHLNPIRTEISRSVSFPHVRWGEDHAWSLQIYDKLSKEYFIKRIMYYYRCKYNA